MFGFTMIAKKIFGAAAAMATWTADGIVLLVTFSWASAFSSR
jgi:hypothetical protein